MKKLLWPMVFAIIGFVCVDAHATCASTDIMCYVVSAVQRFRVTTAGNTTVGGTLTVTGATTHTGAVTNSSTITNGATTKNIYSPSSVSIATYTSISPVSTYINLLTTGTANVSLTVDAGYGKSLAAGTNGQQLIIGSTTSVTTVTLSSGVANGWVGTDLTVVISSTKSAVSFIYDSAIPAWREIGRQ
jgi:hypothetical protein